MSNSSPLDKETVNSLNEEEFKEVSPVKPKLKSNSINTMCPICYSYPLIKVLKDQPDKIEVNCKCGFEQKIQIKEYFHQMKHIQKKNPKCERNQSHSEKIASEFCHQCNIWLCEDCKNQHRDYSKDHYTSITPCQSEDQCYKHISKNYEYFCEQCKDHLCVICKIEHTGHHVISLNSYITEEKMEHIKDNLVQANNYLNGYYANLKDNCIKLLKEQIKRIQFAYEQSYNINNEILQLAHIMVDNYVPSCQNYYVMTNLINNTSFKFAKCEELDKKYSLNQNNINTLIKFFQTNVIVGNEEKKTKIEEKEIVEEEKENEDFIEEPIPIKKVDLSLLKEEVSLTDYKGNINTLQLLKDGRLASCSSEYSIKIFSLITYKCELSLSGHTNTVTYVSQLENGKLLSSSYDNSIKIWNLKGMEFSCESTIQAHDHWVIKIIPLTGNRMASCSKDKKIKIWKSDAPFDLVSTLLGHTFWVNSIIQLKDQDILVSGSSGMDGTIRVWSLVSYECIQVICNVCCCYRNGLLEFENKVIVGGQKRIKIVNLTSYKIDHMIEDDNLGFVSAFGILRDGSVLCGCGAGKLFQLNPNSYSCYLVKENAHSSDVVSIIELDDSSFITSSDENSIKKWSY